MTTCIEIIGQPQKCVACGKLSDPVHRSKVGGRERFSCARCCPCAAKAEGGK